MDITAGLVERELENYNIVTELENSSDMYKELDEIIKEANQKVDIEPDATETTSEYKLDNKLESENCGIYQIENIDLYDTYFLTRILASVLALNGYILPSKVFVTKTEFEGITENYRVYTTDLNMYTTNLNIKIPVRCLDEFIKNLENDYTAIKYTDVTDTYSETDIVEHNKKYLKD